jgi:pimeloyl-ACP methyl ester carboxylesterase
MPEDLLVSTRRGTFPALAAGPEDGPLVLLLHGFPDLPTSYRPVIARLAAAGLRAVAPRARGYHPAPMEGPFDLDHLAGDVFALADALSPARLLTLVGHDWGAVVGYAALAAGPERFSSAILLSVPHPVAFLEGLARSPDQLRCSWYMGYFQPPGLAERQLRRSDFALIDRLWRDWSPGLSWNEHHRPEDRAALKACLARSLPAPLDYYRAMLWPPVEAIGRTVRARGHRIPVPTLHLTGADDGCIRPGTSRGQERFFSGPFASEIIAGVGHFMPLECPDLIADRILDHRARHGGGG